VSDRRLRSAQDYPSQRPRHNLRLRPGRESNQCHTPQRRRNRRNRRHLRLQRRRSTHIADDLRNHELLCVRPSRRTPPHPQRRNIQLHLWRGEPTDRANQRRKSRAVSSPRPTRLNSSHHRRNRQNRRRLHLYPIRRRRRTHRHCHSRTPIRRPVHGQQRRLSVSPDEVLRPCYGTVFDG
jgi:hypothetical protein